MKKQLSMKHKQSIHFIGIGGSGMSGIAEVLLNLGYKVTGSDLKDTDATRRLKRLGAKVSLGHAAGNVPEATSVVVVSNAVPDTNPEIAAARERNLPVIPRAQMLNDLMRLKQGVAIAGTHGKTTTTSMLAWILAQAGMDPTMIIGGILNNINQGAALGHGDYFVVEACEAYSSFLHLTPAVAAVTNIDDDHLENYGSRGALDDAFVSFINRVPFWGFAVLNTDDPGIRAVLSRVIPRTITVGFEAGAELRATSPVVDHLRQNFMVSRHHRNLGRLQLRLPGRFNVLNALAATAVALELGVGFATIQKALAAFSGVRRRFEHKGTFHGATVVDDYGHHPTEVAATLTAARGLNPPRVVVAFQPHLFSRTQRLYKEFAQALMLADAVYVADIYPARERPMAGVTSQLIIDQLQREGHPAAGGPLPLDALLAKLKKELKPGDLFLTMGAGDIWKLGEALTKAEKTKVKTAAKHRPVKKGKKA
jgi:UDP-N-acetylmuramate--alanine ligase